MSTIPAILLTQLLNVYCNISNCDSKTYPTPIPEGFTRNQKYLFDQNEMVPPIVYTKFGIVEGYYMTALSGRQIFAFEGIPYAEKPIRFQEPQWKSPWNGKLEAKNPGPICVQFTRRGVKGDEDCLRLNVYTPQIRHKNSPDTGSKLPVLIFTHGGGFMFGSGRHYGPAYLLREDIVLVTFNYRLGIFGSMTTGDGVASGNWGLKDQAMVINWVYDNIEAFGGDPRKITLSGQSAGAASVHLQMMSSWANDKLASAISFSGGAFNFWGLNTLKQGIRIGREYAKEVGCPINQTSVDMIECMRNVPANTLVANPLVTFDLGKGLAVPCIEPNVEGAFLSMTPDEAYASGKVARIPYVTTITSEETNDMIASLKLQRILTLLRPLFDRLAPILLGYHRRVPSKREAAVFKRIKKFYEVDGLFADFSEKFFSRVTNARFFQVPFHKTVQMHSQIAPTYAGIFNYVSSIGNSARKGDNPEKIGVTHSDDIVLLFNSTSSPPIRVEDEHYTYTKFLSNIYTNFAAKGEPLYTSRSGDEEFFWEMTRDPQEVKILLMGKEIEMIHDPFVELANFWESLGISDMTPYLKL